MTLPELRGYRDRFLAWEEEELARARAEGRGFAVLDVCHCPALPEGRKAQREVLDYVTSQSERARRQRAEKRRLLRREAERAERLSEFLRSRQDGAGAATQAARAGALRAELRALAELEEEAAAQQGRSES